MTNDHLLTRTQAARFLGLSPHTVEGHIRRGHFPEPDMIAGNHHTAPRLWKVSTLTVWDNGRRKIPGPVPKDAA